MPSPRTRTPGTPHPCPLSGLRSPSNGLAGRVAQEGLRGSLGLGGCPEGQAPSTETGSELGPTRDIRRVGWGGDRKCRSLVYLRTQVRAPHDWGHPGHSWGSWAGGHVPAGRQGKEKGTRQAWGTGSRCPVGLEQHPRVPWPFRFLACLAALPGRSLVSPMCGSGETRVGSHAALGTFFFSVVVASPHQCYVSAACLCSRVVSD